MSILMAVAMIDAAVTLRAVKPVGLSRVVPMVDVSGSMYGTPLAVSIFLGILASEVTHKAFRVRVLIFAEEPSWINLSGETSFVEKTHRLMESPMGYSTDFYRAMKLICAVVRENNLGADENPDLLVISDMQFNECVRIQDWQTDF